MRLLHPDAPFAPRRVPFFYGWVVLIAATVGIIMSIPGQTMGVSVFTDPLLAATGLSREGLSYAYFAGTLTSGLMLPRGGRLLDRFGARATAIGATTGLGIALITLSAIDRIGDTLAGVLAFIDGAIVSWIVVALAFAALRFTGQGMLTMTSRTMFGKWFDRRRGAASAVSGVFVAFGFAAAPVGLNAWIDAAGWRGAWIGMAAVVVMGMGGLAWLLFRDNPEECGLRMDGEAADGSPPPAEASSTRAEALVTPAFWAVTLALTVHSLTVTGFTFHLVSVGADAGLARDEVVRIFVPMAVCSTITGALVGWAADRARIRTLLFVMLGAEIIGYAGATQLGHPIGLALTVVGFGVTGGFFGPLSAIALPRLFGRTHLGAIGGSQAKWFVGGSALGPPIFALSHEHAGGYGPALGACAVLPCLVLVLNAVARHPRDEPPERKPAH